MSDIARGLPVRTEGDASEKLQSRIIDRTTDGQGLEVDSDNAAKTRMTGRDSGGVNRTVLTSTTGQVHVVVDDNDADETPVGDYDTSSAIAAAASDTHTYTVPGGKTLLLMGVYASASGRHKVEIKAGVAASETTRAVGFGSVANPNVYIPFDEPIRVTTGQNVLVVRTNTDNQAQDVYSTIVGTLI